MRHLASSVISSCTPSVNMRASCCFTKLFSGSVRMVYISFSVSGLSSTRMGSRPCNSASRSDGLQKWKAPDAMKRMWSVLTLPCFVVTVDPSKRGSKSRCTPSEEASADPRYSPREQILSISSIKIMPSCSTLQSAWRLMSSSDNNFSLSSSVRIGTASLSCISRFSIFCLPCIILSKRKMISFIGNWFPPEGSPCPLGLRSGTSISISRSSRCPIRRSLRNASRLC
mmetsp:Transcript_17478/g.52796  ORF Transcript_17478/g.52796 Transcript_17478/m.52796 type:complete len:227 (-) Transcript_17478:713-1393(-)